MVLFRGTAPFEAHGTSPLAVVLAYYVGFGAAGALVGWLSALARYWVGAVGVAVSASFCIIVAVNTAIDGPFTRWTSDSWIVALGLAVMFGALFGHLWWKTNRQRNSDTWVR